MTIVAIAIAIAIDSAIVYVVVVHWAHKTPRKLELIELQNALTNAQLNSTRPREWGEGSPPTQP